MSEADRNKWDGRYRDGSYRGRTYPTALVEQWLPAAAGARAVEVGLELNAGHDLNLSNLKFFRDHIPGLMEVSIGHALISDALYYGLENTIQMYLRQLMPE